MSAFFCFLGIGSLQATHNRAGEITYTQIDDLTIRITITTYTKTSSASADRDSLLVFWGDGTSELVGRTNGTGTPLPNDVKLNQYIADHTFPGRATYTIYFQDPNRVADVLNVNPPNSIDIPFFLSTTFTFLDPQFQGFNSSAVLLQAPLDFGCVGKTFIHNPNAYDVDGDSIAYELVTPLEDVGLEVPNYLTPDQVGPGPTNNISLDPITGTFTWDTPSIPGEYNIAIAIKEYRNGFLINSIIRDMQILIRVCDNNPPIIEALEEYCVIAGEELIIPIRIDDPDVGQLVVIGATGGPFEIRDSIVLEGPNNYTAVSYTANLKWQTTCNHIFNEYYQVVIRAADNYFGDSTGLATLKTIRIKVIGPPPEDMSGESVDGKLRVEWGLPYTCEETREEYFQGFSVWRKVGSTALPQDSCYTGLEGLGYKEVKFVTTENNGVRYFFEDEDVEPGVIYCYRVLAEFARFTSSGNPFNRTESIASEEVCLILKRDLPYLTEASVISTDSDNGIIKVSWTKPVADDLDTLANPGPYKYQLQLETNGQWVDISGASFLSNTFAEKLDTSFLHTGINTTQTNFNYRVLFYVNGSSTPYGNSAPATSIFLSTMPSDVSVILDWESETAWNNYNYIILRQNLSGEFEEIGQTRDNNYTDGNLNNGTEYCYIVRSEGTYGITGIKSPLLNNSQKSCSVPEDIVPPCPPLIAVENECSDNENVSAQDLGNTISWMTDLSCNTERDIKEYRVYFSDNMQDYTLIHFSSSIINNEYFHQPDNGLSGCYAITGTDSLGNESDFSDIICTENCPGYVLPNTFTPNDDGANDLFVPRVNRFINLIEMEIFNEWGNRVYKTSDPEIRWNGENQNGGQLSEGVYYYVCKVFATGADGQVSEFQRLKGHINLFR